MKRTLLLLVLLAFTVSGSAQNWNPFTPGVNQYFFNGDGYVRGMRIDSVTSLGNDLVYHPYRTPRGWWFDHTPLDTTKGSWLGGNVIKKSDGTFLFDNRWGDTVVIKTKASVGEQWLFYSYSSQRQYIATVTETDTMSFIGLTDSVKHIIITSHNGMNIDTSDILNGYEIILSKHNGFVQVFDLYLFPYHPHDTIYQMGFDYFLDMYTPPTSQQHSIFTRCDFNYPQDGQAIRNIGDEYEYIECFIGGTNNCYHPHSYSYYIVDNVLPVIGTGWSAIRDWSSQWPNYLYDVNNFIQDTIPNNGYAWFFYPYVTAIRMPEESNEAYHWYYYPNDTSYCHVGPRCRFTECYIVYASFFSPPVVNFFEAGGADINFKKDLGLVSGKMWAGGDPNHNEKTLIYYKRSGVECGGYVFPDTSLPVVNSVGLLSGEPVFKVYPNPTTDQLNIESSQGGYRLSLFNALGQLVYVDMKCDPKHSIDVAGFAPGMYHLKLETAGHEVVNRKVLIQ